MQHPLLSGFVPSVYLFERLELSQVVATVTDKKFALSGSMFQLFKPLVVSYTVSIVGSR